MTSGVGARAVPELLDQRESLSRGKDGFADDLLARLTPVPVMRRMITVSRPCSEVSECVAIVSPLLQGPSSAAGTTATPSLRRYAWGPVLITMVSSRSSPICSRSQSRFRTSPSTTLALSFTSIARTR